MDGNTHRWVGSAAGTAWAGYKARHEEPLAVALEAFGGYHGGRAGAALPDVLEPATSPCHRMLAHSVVVGGAVAKVGVTHLEPVVEVLRRRARDFAAAANARDASLLETVLNVLGYACCHIAAGGINGMAAGYVSHLALDAATPASLPLLLGPATR